MPRPSHPVGREWWDKFLRGGPWWHTRLLPAILALEAWRGQLCIRDWDVATGGSVYPRGRNRTQSGPPSPAVAPIQSGGGAVDVLGPGQEGERVGGAGGFGVPCFRKVTPLQGSAGLYARSPGWMGARLCRRGQGAEGFLTSDLEAQCSWPIVSPPAAGAASHRRRVFPGGLGTVNQQDSFP